MFSKIDPHRDIWWKEKETMDIEVNKKTLAGCEKKLSSYEDNQAME